VPKRKLFEYPQEKSRTLSLVVTRSCNLRCLYCYEKHYHEEFQVMDLKIAKEVINHYLCAEDGFDIVTIDFFGGEPLLAFNFIKEVIEWTLSRQWPKRYHFTIGTNGTLLTDEMKNWFLEKKKCLTLSFSIDGNKKAHDLNRSNSYDLLAPHIPFFIENWPNQPAKMTICKETIPYVAESIIELEDMGLYFTANLVFENFWGSHEEEEKLLKIYNEQLMQLVDYYASRPDLFPVHRILDALPIYLNQGGNIFEESNEDYIRFCGSGHEMVIIDLNGQTYPCHRFVPWVTGKPAPTGPINMQKKWEPVECKNCKIIHSCPTCVGYNWEINNNTGIRTTYHCKAFKLEVLASAKLLLLKLKKNKKYQVKELESLSPDYLKQLKRKIEVIDELVGNGI
jgi:uncharacterized protein